MNLYFLILSVIIISFSCISCIFILPYVQKYGLKFGIIDSKEQRKFNFKYLVRFGGLAIVYFLFFFNFGIFHNKLNILDLNLIYFIHISCHV